MGIAAGWWHNVALRNDGTVAVWGQNYYGQTNVPAPLTSVASNAPVKLLAAGGPQTIAGVFNPLTQYQIDVTKDLLLIYNTNSSDSAGVKDYYLAHRPMVANANVLGVGCSNKTETFYPSEYTNLFLPQVTNWLVTNATKRPQYVVLFVDVPSRVNTNADYSQDDLINYPPRFLPVRPSVQHQLHEWAWPNWHPFVAHINMGASNDCVHYIDKLASHAGVAVVLAGGSAAGTNYYFEDAGSSTNYSARGLAALEGVTNNGVSSQFVTYVPRTSTSHIVSGTNVAGYWTWGANGGQGYYFPDPGHVAFQTNSNWYLMGTGESFNGQRFHPNPPPADQTVPATLQSWFGQWFASGAFGGVAYSSTPVAGVSHVDEPFEAGLEDTYVYFGLWAAGKNFATCSWNSKQTPQFQAVGDPLVVK